MEKQKIPLLNSFFKRYTSKIIRERELQRDSDKIGESARQNMILNSRLHPLIHA